ncbi:MAG: 2-iminoacetate synthase ThiH [Spirochaetales bacterium]|nr:2-iminoacetate synthase ThiH [Spirochaetales bacterium]
MNNIPGRFRTILDSAACFPFDDFFAAITPQKVRHIIHKDNLTKSDFLALLSPVAEPFLEEMAQKAHQVTVQQFGKVVFLYTPLYLGNFCNNQCVYCGFNTVNPVPRNKLSVEEIEKEAIAIAESGHRHILILTGEDRVQTSVEYIRQSIEILKKYFSSISIEIYPLSREEYSQLIESGVDNLTIYQETYNRKLYAALHPHGPKKDFYYRLDTPQRALDAAMRTVNIGALLGLDDFRKECFFGGLHARFLQDTYPASEIGYSLPRMQSHAGSFPVPHPVADAHLVQMITALRLFMPRLGISISTREPARLRDKLIPLGVTRMSSGSKTSVGGYAAEHHAGSKQFEISDSRSVKEIEETLFSMGYQPVYKDWERI